MAVLFKKGTFTKATATGNQDITTVGFRPRALILWTSNQTVETFEEHMMTSFGFSDGINDCVVVCRSEDNSATSDTDSNVYNDAIIQIINAATSGAEEARATLNAWLDSGFQLNWAVNTNPAAVIHYIAIGGDDITNVRVGTQAVGTTTTGNKAYTGIGFQPDFLLTANNGALPGAGAYTFNTTIETNCGIGISAMKSATERWAISTASEDARTTSDAHRYFSTSKCFAYNENDLGTVIILADFVSFNADGWTWNYTTNTTANNQNAVYIYLAIKGGKWDVGSFSSPATAIPTTLNTVANATLKGAMFFGIAETTVNDGTLVGNNFLYIGGSDGVNNGVTSYEDITSSANMVVVRRQNDDDCLYTLLANATAGSSTIFEAASATFQTGSISVNSSVSSGGTRIHQYWAVSENFTPHSYGKINTMLDNNVGPATFG